MMFCKNGAEFGATGIPCFTRQMRYIRKPVLKHKREKMILVFLKKSSKLEEAKFLVDKQHFFTL